MKVIIAGGRRYIPTDEDLVLLKKLHGLYGFTEIVSGGCRGGDKVGENFARQEVIQLKVYPAEWSKYGRAGGPMRNYAMARYADAVILFPGGRGTDSMRQAAREHGLKILYDGGRG